MKKYIRADFLTPLVTALGMVIYGVEALRLSPPVVNGVVQESFFPIIICLFGIPTAISLVVDSLKKIKANGPLPEKDKEEKWRGVKCIILIAVAFFMVLAFDALGFWFTVPVYVFVAMNLYDDHFGHYLKRIIYSIIISTLIYALYVNVFDIRFPSLW